MVNGQFRKLSLPQWEAENVTILWDLATISVGIPDVSGLQGRTVLSWGEQEIGFEPGASSQVLGSCLAAIYGYLYVLLQLEEYALLLGSVGLLLILALIMYLTRNLNWTTLRLNEVPAETA